LPQFTLATSVVGSGSIQQTPTGTSFAANTAITLTAVPGANSSFAGWTGVCPGSTVLVCAFTITGNTTAIATFAANTPPPPTTQFTLQTVVSGPGTITQNPSGSLFNAGAIVTLTAVPNPGATFSFWTGGFTTSTLTVTMNQNWTIGATFATAPPPTPASLVITPAKFSGNAGQTFTGQIVTTGFTGTPKLSASCQIPMGACSVSGSTLTIATTGTDVAVAATRPALPWLLPLGFLGALLILPRKVRKTVVCIGTLAFCAACGSSTRSVAVTPAPSSTPAGTYQIQIIAAAGSQSVPASAVLIVQ
jgi:hypothetical protein